MLTVYQQISRNKRRSSILILLFFVIIICIGYFLGEYSGSGYGITGVVYASMIALLMTLFSFFGGDKVALMTSGAQEIQKEDAPYVWRMVENLAITAGLSMPRVYIIDDPVMNAFATGRDPKHASIALTTGIINQLENEELEAVIAHELSHVKNFDTRLMMIVIILVGIITLLADWMWRVRFFGGRDRDSRGSSIELIFAVVGIALIILSPIIAELIKLAISRKREYLADASAVLLTRYADGLANALKKIGTQDGRLRQANHATAHLYLVNPFGPGKDSVRRWFSHIFSTHPPIEDRIRILQEMGGQVGK